ncbi:hypothetical protein [Actinokineospora sp. NBRC 105648]|uniref:hypothetical protein n=1 Tax=Actinokineospora sp. NBRC 105648 TaxID=3032206 RepID=UPI0024A0FE2C|nr:hypothetical protein [Actinokineospora sp. NBRC 105648]GLZ37654.1 hypothetical protein Acsp05_12790 [Actinokineospora sp. NBRC 105648]
MTENAARAAYRDILRQRVGAFFRNVRYGPPGSHCANCGVPPVATGSLCSQCGRQRQQFGDRLASQVVLLAYVKGYAPGGPHQSAHTVRAYKQEPWPVRKCATDLASMVSVATRLHGNCIADAHGPCSAITFVPSVRHPGTDHPVVTLARQVSGLGVDRAAHVVLGLGPGSDPGYDRTVRADRFELSGQNRSRVRGRHVMVVDDTWTSGAKVQSAAVALRDAGAEHVTALVVGRWCDYRAPDHKAMLDSLDTPYDALVCPVSGGTCP